MERIHLCLYMEWCFIKNIFAEKKYIKVIVWQINLVYAFHDNLCYYLLIMFFELIQKTQIEDGARASKWDKTNLKINFDSQTFKWLNICRSTAIVNNLRHCQSCESLAFFWHCKSCESLAFFRVLLNRLQIIKSAISIWAFYP